MNRSLNLKKKNIHIYSHDMTYKLRLNILLYKFIYYYLQNMYHVMVLKWSIE